MSNETINVFVAHNGGAGFAGTIPITKGMTLPQLYSQELGGTYHAAGTIITVNKKVLTDVEASAYILQDGDDVTLLAANEKNGLEL